MSDDDEDDECEEREDEIRRHGRSPSRQDTVVDSEATTSLADEPNAGDATTSGQMSDIEHEGECIARLSLSSSSSCSFVRLSRAMTRLAVLDAISLPHRSSQ